MTILPDFGTTVHLNQDIDSVFQARGEIENVVWRCNVIQQYLIDLFGWSSQKDLAVSTLFSNQAVLFPTGTRLWFHQSYPPPGWVQLTGFSDCYLMAVPYPGADQWFGNNNQTLPTSSTVLIQQHLPVCQFHGAADWQGHHAHNYSHTIVDYQGGNVAFERDANGPKAFARYESWSTDGAGSHAHNIVVNSGGGGWGHDHYISMATYRPYTTTGIIAWKT